MEFGITSNDESGPGLNAAPVSIPTIVPVRYAWIANLDAG
jgi:hypothetical protein